MLKNGFPRCSAKIKNSLFSAISIGYPASDFATLCW
jgi:hypothetical protein